MNFPGTFLHRYFGCAGRPALRRPPAISFFKAKLKLVLNTVEVLTQSKPVWPLDNGIFPRDIHFIHECGQITTTSTSRTTTTKFTSSLKTHYFHPPWSMPYSTFFWVSPAHQIQTQGIGHILSRSTMILGLLSRFDLLSEESSYYHRPSRRYRMGHVESSSCFRLTLRVVVPIKISRFDRLSAKCQ